MSRFSIKPSLDRIPDEHKKRIFKSVKKDETDNMFFGGKSQSIGHNFFHIERKLQPLVASKDRFELLSSDMNSV